LAKFRGLINGVKYSDVIGKKKKVQPGNSHWENTKNEKKDLPTNHSAVFHSVHQTTKFAKLLLQPKSASDSG
jgi:hypothetical protein